MDEATTDAPIRRRDRRKRLGYTLTVNFQAPADESANVVTKVLGALGGVEVEGVNLNRERDTEPDEG